MTIRGRKLQFHNLLLNQPSLRSKSLLATFYYGTCFVKAKRPWYQQLLNSDYDSSWPIVLLLKYTKFILTNIVHSNWYDFFSHGQIMFYDFETGTFWKTNWIYTHELQIFHLLFQKAASKWKPYESTLISQDSC